VNVSCSAKSFSNVSERYLQCCLKTITLWTHSLSFVRVTSEKAHLICSAAFHPGACNLCCREGRQLLERSAGRCGVTGVDLLALWWMGPVPYPGVRG